MLRCEDVNTLTSSHHHLKRAPHQRDTHSRTGIDLSEGVATEIDADAAYQSCEDDAEERHPEWYEAWEQEIVHPHNGGEA